MVQLENLPQVEVFKRSSFFRRSSSYLEIFTNTWTCLILFADLVFPTGLPHFQRQHPSKHFCSHCKKCYMTIFQFSTQGAELSLNIEFCNRCHKTDCCTETESYYTFDNAVYVLTKTILHLVLWNRSAKGTKKPYRNVAKGNCGFELI